MGMAASRLPGTWPGSLQRFQLGQHLLQGRPGGDLRSLAFATGLQFHHTVVKAAFSDCYAKRHPYQLPFSEHDARPGVAVVQTDIHAVGRAEERRVGKECVRWWLSRLSPYT